MEYRLIEGKNFPEVWEKALIECWENGERLSSDFQGMEEHMVSKDMTMMLVVNKPDSEPKYHKAGFPMSIDELFSYVDEVVDGTRDDRIDKLGYTYHDRMVNFRDNIENNSGVNQIDYVVEELKRAGYTRRAQMVIWNPKVDTESVAEDVPCLQRLWFRIINNKLNMNVHMRSNDLFKANFSNMIAFHFLHKKVADRLDVGLGSYCHIADSMHIYGSYFEEVEKTLEELDNRSWDEKVWTTDEIQNLKGLV